MSQGFKPEAYERTTLQQKIQPPTRKLNENPIIDQSQFDESRFRNLVENANDFLYMLNLDGFFEYISPSVKSVLGYRQDELLNRHYSDFMHPDEHVACADIFARLFREPHRETGIEYRYHHADGTWHWHASNTASLLDDHGTIIGVVGVDRDITQQRKAQEDLRISENRYKVLAETARDVVWTMSLDGAITYVSPAVEVVRGLTPEEAIRQSLDEILTPSSQVLSIDYFMGLHADILSGQTPRQFRGQMEYYRKDGTIHWADVIATPVLASDGTVVEVLGISRDISEFKSYEAELHGAKVALEEANRSLADANSQLTNLAAIDPLTGAFNRRHFEETIEKRLLEAQRHEHPISLAIFDIDHFKTVNDTFGHAKGDQVLIELSKLVRLSLRASDELARWGGEEFVVLMPHISANDAMKVAEKLRLKIANHRIADIGVVTVSFGVAEARQNETFDHWLSRADDALYKAKGSGRNAVHVAE
jgi:diguanylate cyclase (GGDEF)-like protein/PAS domain S-box-containing protein